MMFMSDVKQAYVSVMDDRKRSRTRWKKPIEALQRPQHIKTLKYIRYYFAAEALLALMVNYYLVDSFSDDSIDFSYAVVAVGFILVSMLLKWMFLYLFLGVVACALTASSVAFIPVSMALKYIFARRDQSGQPGDDLELFTEKGWLIFFGITQVYLILMWFFPETILWPAEALGLDRDDSLIGSLYLAGFIACGMVWTIFKRAVESRKNQAMGSELAGWLRRPRSLEDFVSVPLLFAAFFLVFGYLALPVMDLGIQVVTSLVSAGFVGDMEYGQIVAVYPREQLLAILDHEKLGILEGLVLPTAEGMKRSFGFNLDQFRSVRDTLLPHLLPVTLLMSAALLWMRQRLSSETMVYAGP